MNILARMCISPVNQIFSETALVVRYAETDRMGIVHHSNYPVWFEAGRTDFIKKLGMSYSEMENNGYLLPLIELNCRFVSAANYEDNIIIRTSVKEVTCTRLRFHYQALKSGILLAEGETLHVWTDVHLKPINIKKHNFGIYNLISDACEKKPEEKYCHEP